MGHSGSSNVGLNEEFNLQTTLGYTVGPETRGSVLLWGIRSLEDPLGRQAGVFQTAGAYEGSLGRGRAPEDHRPWAHCIILL